MADGFDAKDVYGLLRGRLGEGGVDALVRGLAWALQLEKLRGGEEALAAALVAAHVGPGAVGPTAPMRVRRFLSRGELDPACAGDTDALLDQAAGLMRKSCADDILGPVLFEGEDGRVYELSLSAVIDEADPERAAEFGGRGEEAGAAGREERFHAEVVRPYEKNGNLLIHGRTQEELDDRVADFVAGDLDAYLEGEEAEAVRALLDAGRRGEAVALFFEKAEDLGLRCWAAG